MCCPDPYNYPELGTAEDQVAFEKHLAARGLRLIEDGSYSRVAAAADLPEDNEPPGPVPEETLEEETGAQCRFCGRTAAGPPEPYCCAGRKHLDLKINAGEHPIFPGPANDQDD